MLVRILRADKYNNLNGDAVNCQVGDTLRVHTGYGQGLINANLAEAIGVKMSSEPALAEGGMIEVVKITKAARQLAEDNGLDLSEVEGTGADGKITISDVRRALDE